MKIIKINPLPISRIGNMDTVASYIEVGAISFDLEEDVARCTIVFGTADNQLADRMSIEIDQKDIDLYIDIEDAILAKIGATKIVEPETETILEVIPEVIEHKINKSGMMEMIVITPEKTISKEVIRIVKSNLLSDLIKKYKVTI